MDPTPAGHRLRRVVRRQWGYVAGGAVLAGALAALLPLTFPSGADPGHMLAFAHGVPARHPPVVPWLFAALHAAAGGALSMELLGVKVLAVASAGVFALGLAAVAGRLTDDPQAPGVAFALGVVNPLTLYQILWGGLAQFWGLAFGAVALAGMLAWREGRRARVAAAVFGVLAAYTHWYSMVFLVPAGAWIFLSRRPWQGRQLRLEALAVAAAVALLAVPAVGTYAAIAGGVRLARGPPTIVSPGYLADFGVAIGARLPIAVAVLALLGLTVLVAARHRWPPGARRDRVLHWTVGGVLGQVALLAVTPVELAGRAHYFLPVVVIPLLAVVLAGHRGRPLLGAWGSGRGPGQERGRERGQGWGRGWVRTRGRRAGRGRDGPPVRVAHTAAMTGVLILASTAPFYLADRSFFSPMGEPSMAAFRAVDDLEGVAVYSPLPNVDAWWMEAVAGVATRPTDLARFYTFEDEVRQMDAARRAGAGEVVLEMGGGAVAASPATGHPAAVTVLARERGDVFPVLEVWENASTVVDVDGAERSLRPPRSGGSPVAVTDRGFRNGTYEERWPAATGPDPVVRRVAVRDGALVVTYSLPGPADRLRLSLAAGPDGSWRPAGDGLVHRWAPADATTRLGLAGVDRRAVAEASATVEVPVVDGTARLVVALDEPLKAPDEAVPATELLASIGADAVYLRDVPAGLRARFVHDPAFRTVFHQGDVTVLRAVGPP